MELTGIRGTVLSFMVPELPGLDIAGPPAESYDAPALLAVYFRPGFARLPND